MHRSLSTGLFHRAYLLLLLLLLLTFSLLILIRFLLLGLLVAFNALHLGT